MRVLISGGGTGGHIFPALAVARALTELDPNTETLYVGRRGGMEERIVPAEGIPCEYLDISGIQPEWRRNLGLVYRLPAALASATAITRRFKPRVVFGTGGYVVGPVGVAALLTRRPLFLQLPDAYPGKTIRWLGNRARAVCAAYDATAAHLPRARVVVTGTPVREPFQGRHGAGDVERLQHLVVFGGSQGAHRINTAVAEAVKSLLNLSDLRVTHVCGKQDLGWLSGFRAGLTPGHGSRYEVRAFEDHMDRLLPTADLVLARAGGSGIAEMTALGLPMLLVPGTFAGGHQADNAAPLERSGAAVVVPDNELSGIRLSSEVQRLHGDPDRLRAMARASAAFGRPGAAREIATMLLEAGR